MAAIDGVRKGCVAVFGAADAALGTERLVVVAETRETETTARDRLQQDILEAVSDALGVPPDTVALARPGAVLKTSSGKVRRSATRDAYLAGALDRGAGSMTRQWLTLGWHAVAARGRRAADLLLRVSFTAYIVAMTPGLGAAALGARPDEQPAGHGTRAAQAILTVRRDNVGVPARGWRVRAPSRPWPRDLRGQPRELLRRGRGARYLAREPPVRRQGQVGDLPGARDGDSEGGLHCPSRRRG